MAGMAYQLIKQVFEQRTRGNESLNHFVRARLLLKGIDPEKFDQTTEDNPVVIEKLRKMIREFDG